MPSFVPSTKNFTGKRVVHNGVGYSGYQKPLTPEERQALLRQANADFNKYMERLNPRVSSATTTLDLHATQLQFETENPELAAALARGAQTVRPPVARFPLKFIQQTAATLDATGKNTFPAAAIIKDVNNQLTALQTDHIDIAFFPWPASETLVGETLGAYDSLLKEGKILALGGMDLTAAQLSQILSAAAALGFPGYQALAVNYNLFDRSVYEGALQDLVVKENIAALPYTSLADGFLTGKYRTMDDLIQNQLSTDLARYFTPSGFAILDAQAAIAAKYGVPAASVALAWLMVQPGVAMPLLLGEPTIIGEEDAIATAAVELTLSADDIELLTKAGL
ncbi:aldo/keto reductase [Kosakonia oryzae]|uniref:aldo/keto reductase n=1 Tax=Kosakonia oryzae TaxID=497725 RepID=UPI001D05DDCF|nr:aldo/keto reductase [Kosakonia oryzae]UDJ84304.1 aldo/keto reductase [Kosakonia oryzae]